MRCKGCYKEVNEGYCLSCRKKLFDKARIPAVLSFDPPKGNNIASFQQHTKRLSISGVQLKYSLRLENKELVLTEQKGEYILKPIPPASQLEALQDVPENEHLTMQIADQIFKIPTAANALIYFKDGTPAYLTKRFDVRADGMKFQQEDFAQLTNRTKEANGEHFKYDGSYEEIGELIKKYVATSVITMERFFQLVVFNYVVSNGDAHLKNFSLIRSEEGEYNLTPAYDIMSSVIHTPQESDTALDLYDKDIESTYYLKYGHYGRVDFLELAKRLGIQKKRAVKVIDSFSEKSNAVFNMIAGSFLSDETKKTYIKNVADKITRLIGVVDEEVT